MDESQTNLERLRELQEELDTAERELAQRDALLAAIVSSAHDAIIARDLDGRIIAWNQAATDLYGWNSEEMIGHSVFRIIPKDKFDEHESWVERIKKGESFGPIQTERITKDGERIPIVISLSPIVARNGEVLETSAIEHQNGEADERNRW